MVGDQTNSEGLLAARNDSACCWSCSASYPLPSTGTMRRVMKLARSRTVFGSDPSARLKPQIEKSLTSAGRRLTRGSPWLSTERHDQVATEGLDRHEEGGEHRRTPSVSPRAGSAHLTSHSRRRAYPLWLILPPYLVRKTPAPCSGPRRRRPQGGKEQSQHRMHRRDPGNL